MLVGKGGGEGSSSRRSSAEVATFVVFLVFWQLHKGAQWIACTGGASRLVLKHTLLRHHVHLSAAHACVCGWLTWRACCCHPVQVTELELLGGLDPVRDELLVQVWH